MSASNLLDTSKLPPLRGSIRDDFLSLCVGMENGIPIDIYCADNDINLGLMIKCLSHTSDASKIWRDAREKGDDILRVRVLSELQYLAFMDMKDIYDEDGQPLPIDKLPLSVRKSIKSIEKTDRGVKIHFVDKLKSIELLGKELGMFQQKVNHKIDATIKLESLIGQTWKDDETNGQKNISSESND